MAPRRPGMLVLILKQTAKEHGYREDSLELTPGGRCCSIHNTDSNHGCVF